MKAPWANSLPSLCVSHDSVMLPSHNRYGYTPIDKRPVFDWPDGKPERVWSTLPGQIARHCQSLPHGIIPKG
ncbi:MAG: hypothetical protein ACOYL0_11355 [Limnohabitans sp.]